MSREQNLDIVKRWFQLVWNERREDLIDTFINPAGVAHLEGKDIRTPDEFRDVQREFFSAFPDLSVVVEDTLADDTNVVVRGMTWLRFENGIMMEGFDSWNLGGMLESLK
jgi:predicted ester cyclase